MILTVKIEDYIIKRQIEAPRENTLTTNKKQLVRPTGWEINEHGPRGCSSVVVCLREVLGSVPASQGRGGEAGVS